MPHVDPWQQVCIVGHMAGAGLDIKFKQVFFRMQYDQTSAALQHHLGRTVRRVPPSRSGQKKGGRVVSVNSEGVVTVLSYKYRLFWPPT